MRIRKPYNFDELDQNYRIRRIKHIPFQTDTVAAWVADMDFPVANEIIDALQERLERPYFGYSTEPADLREIICERLKWLYNWEIKPEHIIFETGVIGGFNMGLRLNARPNGRFLVFSPTYPPMLRASGGAGQRPKPVPMCVQQDGQRLYYELDYAAFEAAIDPSVHSYIHCNPYNPGGRILTADEQRRLAEICLKHDLLILSDEIHCELRYDDRPHVPMASLSREIADHTITFMSASKAFNLPALRESFTVITNDALRQRYIAARSDLAGHTSEMGLVAMRAAFRYGDNWLWQVLEYLKANRDFAMQRISQTMPDVSMTMPEATYLLWLDVRRVIPENHVKINAADLADGVSDDMVAMANGNINPFFLRRAGVALNDGAHFLAPGFVRLNYAMPRPLLAEALQRMAEAVSGLAVR